MIKVKRRSGCPEIKRFSMGDLPSIEFPDDLDEVFEIDIRAFPALGEYVEFYKAPNAQETKVKEFILGHGSKSHKIEVK